MEVVQEKRKVIWLLSSRQKMVNSASELAYETLQGTDFQVERFGPFPVGAALRAYRASRRGALIYFQFGTLGENLSAACLVAAGCPVIAHYLDQIAKGYPSWARKLRLHEIIHYILRRTKLVLAISPAMKSDIEIRLGRTGPVQVKFRTNPDSEPPLEDAEPKHKDAVIFAGNINKKTNFDALLAAQDKLQARNLRLVVHTRTKDSDLLKELRAAGVEIQPEIPASAIVQHSFGFRAQLLPFNMDSLCQDFYRTSTPSKLPNLFMARRPIFYLGPSNFWLRNWLAEQGDFLINLESEAETTLPGLDPVSCEAAQRALRNFRALSGTIAWDAL